MQLEGNVLYSHKRSDFASQTDAFSFTKLDRELSRLWNEPEHQTCHTKQNEFCTRQQANEHREYYGLNRTHDTRDVTDRTQGTLCSLSEIASHAHSEAE